jgi:diaminohydroxyphosphoribosylaminopyrimidine deaminase / 5-amino-6-(5-phosphoribosylamino)uracil reductase
MTTDDLYMRKALDLARAGVGLVTPNPAVGAVLIDKSDREVGSGTHTFEGVKHAEILALEQAGQSARGGTLYLNLEPCSHRGRTGPCADAVVAAGVSRVVCSMQDPNPQVAGRGFQRLREAGIKVEVGLLEAEAKKLNESFAKFITTGKPLVTLKAAMSLDGKIAPAPKMCTPRAVTSKSEDPRAGNRWITGEAAREHVHRLRHQNDAILVGVGTVIADDPLLSDRSALPRRRNLLRVILDSSLRVPIESRIFREVQDDILVISSSPDRERQRAIEAKGIRVLQTAASVGGRLDFAAIFRSLGEMEITSVLVEGGSTVNATVLASGEVDKVVLYYAPRILGAEAVPFLAKTGDAWQMRCVDRIEFHRFGEDLAIEGYLRDPYVV